MTAFQQQLCCDVLYVNTSRVPQNQGRAGRY